MAEVMPCIPSGGKFNCRKLLFLLTLAALFSYAKKTNLNTAPVAAAANYEARVQREQQALERILEENETATQAGRDKLMRRVWGAQLPGYSTSSKTSAVAGNPSAMSHPTDADANLREDE